MKAISCNFSWPFSHKLEHSFWALDLNVHATCSVLHLHRQHGCHQEIIGHVRPQQPTHKRKRKANHPSTKPPPAAKPPKPKQKAHARQKPWDVLVFGQPLLDMGAALMTFHCFHFCCWERDRDKEKEREVGWVGRSGRMRNVWNKNIWKII